MSPSRKCDSYKIVADEQMHVYRYVEKINALYDDDDDHDDGDKHQQ